MIDVNKFEYMKIGLASPEKILEWSHGEVKKHETINYRTLKPEKEGLFCEKIFGPTKDWECTCGKYKRVRYRGVVCDKCGVEITQSKVRRERMGHIKLAAPVAHIWYFRGIPSRMGLLLDISPKDLEEVMYFHSYIVVDPGNTPLKAHQLLSDKEYYNYIEEYGLRFKAGKGAETVKLLLQNLNLEQMFTELRQELNGASGQRRTRIIKRLDVLKSFLDSDNLPEWMIMDTLPVIPPDLRPMVQLDGGRFATSDLNDLYRRVITRNTRLKKLIDMGAPSIIVQNEKRMLQESVDSLIDNGKRGRPALGSGNRPLKSLSHMLKGKQGRFRQNLLGKRVDYSGRSVIVVGPELKMHECGLPKTMLLELFKPFVIKELVSQGVIQNIKNARKLIERNDDRIWDMVEKIIENRPVLLNRAPTLHRLGIQAFYPKITEGKAIKLHPLVTPAFNADFDGDQMAVHLPLSNQAILEAKELMLASKNILNPKDGRPVVTPSQDMVLGNYYLTMEKPDAVGEGKVFSSEEEAHIAFENKYITLHSRILIKTSALDKDCFTETQKEKYIITTLGKIIFNNIFPKEFVYINEPTLENIENQTPDVHFISPGVDYKKVIKDKEIVSPFKKKVLANIIAEIFKRYKTEETPKMLDRLKNLGFKYSTIGGITIGLSDVVGTRKKGEIISKAENKVATIKKYYNKGYLTEEERYKLTLTEWKRAKDDVEYNLMLEFETEHPYNPIYMMSDSGARGNASNFTQLAGMRGLMANPSGQIIELPIKSSFKEGLDVSEFFISTHGARKGLADTAIKTAGSGYLTRRLVDVAHKIIVRVKDCGTDKGFVVNEIADKNKVIVSLTNRIQGRYANKPVIDPDTKEVYVDANEYITEDIARKIEKSGIKEVEIRSILTCDEPHGVCSTCYGQNLATGEIVNIGEAVGILAAQSIGEPGTQLTMRTFHSGGVAGNDITQGLPRIQELFEARDPKGKAVISEITGTVKEIKPSKKRFEIIVSNNKDEKSYIPPYGASLKVVEGQSIEAGDQISEGSIDPRELLRAKDINAVQNYFIKEVQKVYTSVGEDISDKHIEVIARQMMHKLQVVDAGDSDLLPGSYIDKHSFAEINQEIIMRDGVVAFAIPVLLGITKASLETDSFLSAASFQETTKVLTDAAIKGKEDKLVGLKENVIIGKLIPTNTISEQRFAELEEDFYEEENIIEE